MTEKHSSFMLLCVSTYACLILPHGEIIRIRVIQAGAINEIKFSEVCTLAIPLSGGEWLHVSIPGALTPLSLSTLSP